MAPNLKPFVFFGTPNVAKDTLEILRAQGIIPALIITNPDAPQGRGNIMTPSPVKVWAKENNIPVMDPVKITEEVTEEIKDKGFEYGICVAYGKILPESLLNAFPKGIINVHYSLLPKYRGASPVEAALRAGESTLGVSVQKMKFKLDTGDILAAEEMPVGDNETIKDVRPKLIGLGARLLSEILPAFEAGIAEATSQDDASATYCGKYTKADGLLSPETTAKELWNTYRAYADNIGTHMFFSRGEKEIRVSIISAHKDEKMGFVIDTVKPEGKSEMPYADFLRSGAVPIAKSEK